MIEVYSLKYAESVLSENRIFDGGDGGKQIPISFVVYLIKTDKKNILIDAGCDTMPGFVMKDFCSPAAVLKQVGLNADDITDVIITHAHHDHMEAVKHFDKATVYISESAYAKGKKYISDDFDVVTFSEDLIFSPQITIIKWNGHSNGSSIVELKTSEKVHIFAGDECYTNANLEQKRPTGAYSNKDKATEFVEKYSNEKYCVHTCHDISLKTERII